ncbi:MAG TPA: NAD(P)/FAD-dependent oxidoreductase [Frankiaceae bacterium]|nr:NAD(P)/FAD-dependent oxidoreductase [Frankiaceae bacterium]
MTSNPPTAAAAPASSGTTDGVVYDVVVIGGGQAGLALSWHLDRQGLRFLILDAGAEVGHVWRCRWDSLRLFTPTQYDSLPGLAFPGRYDTYPDKNDVADYLRSYVDRFALPLQLNTRVTGLTRSGDLFEVQAGDQTYRASQVVVATGPFQTPSVPAVAARLDSSVAQLHSALYRNPQSLPNGPVLVVGGGNSGLQIAEELIADRPVDVAIGTTVRAMPQRFLGRDLFWWGTKLNVVTAPAESRIGRRLRAGGETLVGTSPRRAARAGIRLRPRVTEVDGATVRFADGAAAEPAAVIWATGYHSDYGWIRVEGALANGEPAHRRGVTQIPGLYFLGLPWQHSRGSALLGFVADDAAHLADQIARRALIPSQGA